MERVIGITLGLDARGRWREGRAYHYTDAAYAHAVEHAGGLPLYLPIQADAKAVVEQVDGLLLAGGDDLLPPTPYPDRVHFEPVPDAQLEFDRSLLGGALELGLPVLGICYGMQLLALHNGGRLHYDIATDLPAALSHQLPEPDGRHAITIEAGSRLASLVGEQIESVNSLHHQAVAEPGRGLRVCARAPDGVIEAIEREGPGFCLGVQWHPEKLAHPSSRALFAGLVAACDDPRAP